MKRILKLILICIAIIVFFINVNTNFANSATLEYTFGDGKKVEVVDKEDIAELESILNGRATIGGGYSCGFGGLEITMKNGLFRQTFIIADDGCNIIYIPSKKLYLDISMEDREKIDEILKKYWLPSRAI